MRKRSFIDLTGRISIVTGGMRGIGAAICAELASAGSAVAVLDIDLAGAKDWADSLVAEFGVKARGYVADISKNEEVIATVDAVARDFGGIDALVNNAGIQFVSPIAEFPDDAWQRVQAINLDGVFYAMKAVWPYLIKRGGGRIVNIASAHGLTASPFKAAYVAAKHGVVGMTKTAAIEGAQLNITVNAVCPGAVMTELVAGQAKDLVSSYGGGLTEEEALERAFLEHTPTHRFIDTEEVGQLCAFLCSHAARSITGAPIPIDGGWVAH